jgi:hypothetical protein
MGEEKEMEHRELSHEHLYNRCEPGQFSFETTADLDELKVFIGQPRAVEALRFGFDINREGYNVFALGHAGTGKHHLVRAFLEKRASSEEVPSDCCYVNDFDEERKPKLLRVPHGTGEALSQDMEKLLEEVRNALRAAFETEEYQNRVQTITQELQEKQQNAFEELKKKSQEKDHQRDSEPCPAGPVRREVAQQLAFSFLRREQE